MLFVVQRTSIISMRVCITGLIAALLVGCAATQVETTEIRMTPSPATPPLDLFSCQRIGVTGMWDRTSEPIAEHTDAEVESMLAQLQDPAISQLCVNEQLLKLGVDLKHLDRIDGMIGNCSDWASYQLSPGYRIAIDNNACYKVDGKQPPVMWISRNR